MRGLISFLAAVGTVFVSTLANAQEVDWQKIDDALGRKPAVSGDVHRFGFPRTDLSVTLDGVTIKPALALGGWAAFKPAHGGAMMMGDLVLLESEITPVMTAVRSSMSSSEPVTTSAPTACSRALRSSCRCTMARTG